MPNYLVTAQAEVLYEKAYGILAKYAKYTYAENSNAPDCIRKIEDELSAYAQNIVLCKDQTEIDDVKKNLAVYENIIDNIDVLLSICLK